RSSSQLTPTHASKLASVCATPRRQVSRRRLRSRFWWASPSRPTTSTTRRGLRWRPPTPLKMTGDRLTTNVQWYASLRAVRCVGRSNAPGEAQHDYRAGGARKRQRHGQWRVILGGGGAALVARAFHPRGSESHGNS